MLHERDWDLVRGICVALAPVRGLSKGSKYEKEIRLVHSRNWSDLSELFCNVQDGVIYMSFCGSVAASAAASGAVAVAAALTFCGFVVRGGS